MNVTGGGEQLTTDELLTTILIALLFPVSLKIRNEISFSIVY
jgi:hypothetical protein